ncbi:beta-phosphoglucomutase family hydrolase [Mycolicibacterium sp. 120270]|uniref:beta-phosphoglucomutase family hydrolase n=1 Tax=Mycolicibacterium sp. 120270 TaxID=3090600 RepID=UPI00299CF1BB|nr:beta-phosphoglucomutase family hydrolase [Mycolicibacterium sp. 120270]MDX1885744.1 beta-phosphoglucomutase family hydrolase [Mycolicibacterium sp. 120270]
MARTPREHTGYRAFVFDMDGVVTDTAKVHAEAWKALFDEMLSRIGGPGQPPFDPVRDYLTYIDGRTREDGIRAFLAARGIALPEGSPDDGPEQLTVHGLAQRKQQLFEEAIARTGVAAFPDAADLLDKLVDRGIPAALVTSSRNGRAVLDAIGLTDMFTTVVDGTDVARLGLRGKPDAAMFLEAVDQLGVEPADAVILEDAVAGVKAGVAGGFGLVVGVDRTAHGEELAEAGADLVVTSLAQLEAVLGDGAYVGRWIGGADRTSSDHWHLVYEDFNPLHEGTREALCTLGNGYWATRGCVPGTIADGVHYPGTYVAGIYNRVTSVVGRRTMETEHLVNAPDWTYLTVQLAGGPVLTPGMPGMLSHHQDLDLRAAMLTRVNRYRDDAGRTTKITSRQIVSVCETHIAALEVTIEAEDWSGEATVESIINGAVANRNVAADLQLESQHLDPVGATVVNDKTVRLEVRTNQSRIEIAMAVRHDVSPSESVTHRQQIAEESRAGHAFTVALQPGVPVTVEKTVAVATSRDSAISTAALDVDKRIARAKRFDDLLAGQRAVWRDLWQRFGIGLEVGVEQALALNLHIFHVLQVIVGADTDLDAGLPARGLHGEGYRGHVFWDELYVYPLLTMRRPELTRCFLLYRYRRLPAARDLAWANGFDGAMFPWQSGSDGRDETPTELFNFRNGQWMPDNSHRQRHVGLAVAYSAWQYYQATGDKGFLEDYGSELIVEVARLFASMAVHDPVDDRFNISGVMGPDEYHDGYPDAPGLGLRNNAYTNVLAAWVLARAAETVDVLIGRDCVPLWRRLDIRPGELERWQQVSRRLRVPFHEGVISQFEGYEALQEFDWESYRERYGNIGRLDLILQAEGDSTNRYKVSKQADVLMLFCLFSTQELSDLFNQMGYSLDQDVVQRTVKYYEARTTHGSTLSRVTHSWVSAQSDGAQSWSLFKEALKADLQDTQGGTTREGIHLGAMAGTADMVLRCYAGVETRADVLHLHPVLPNEIGRASFEIIYRDQPVDIELTHEYARLRLLPCAADPIAVSIEGTNKTLGPGQSWVAHLPAR